MASSIQPRPPATSERRWAEVTTTGHSKNARRRVVSVAIAADYGRGGRPRKYSRCKRFRCRTRSRSEPGRVARGAVGSGVLPPEEALREQDVVLVVERVHLLDRELLAVVRGA